MNQVIQLEGAVNLILGLIAVWGFVRVVNDPANPIEYWHFFASRGPDGGQYGDINKLGLLIGIASATWVFVWYGYKLKLEWPMAIVYLTFIAGVDTYAKWLRSIVGRRFGDHGGEAAPPAPATPSTTKEPAR